ncbi:MAG: hexitol phosphatase HxpB [Bacteroidales bacterium]|nr:MAG: hexitol phosphatase HxpB [Bacteroidales bacterium]
MIKAAIFDLDGVLIDSEPLWKEAEKKIFKTVGISLTTDMCRQTTGLDCIDTVKHWYNYKPWKGKKQEKLIAEIYSEVINLIRLKGKLRKDVDRVLNIFMEKRIDAAVASSSPLEIIKTVLHTFKLDKNFSVIHSSELEKSGKPNPAVYISTAKLLGTEPETCLAFEDSFYGALSAKSARMKVVAILEKEDYNNTKFDFVDLKIKSFEEFNEELLNNINNPI